MKVIILILLSIYGSSISIIPVDANSNDEYCYVDDETPFILFASNTAYEYIRGKRIQSFPKCEVKSLWILGRHGTRDPPQSAVEMFTPLLNLRDQIVRNHLEGRGELCAKDLGILRNWELPYNEKTNALLTDEGRKELYELGSRLKESFPTIFQANYSSNHFQFQASPTNRTQESLRLILKGSFGENVINDILPSRQPDILLQTGTNCDRYRNEVLNNEDSTKEQSLFQETSYIKNVVKNVSKRLGFEKDLTFDDVKLAWDMCSFEATNVQSHPPFCALFTADDFKVMEYHSDLELYYVQGYGTSLTSKLACPLVQNLLLHFSLAASEDPNPLKGIIYNSHAETLMPLYTSLSMFKDDVAPKHDNYASMNSRSWRTSFISSFTSNLVAVLYNCSDELKIAFYVNEKIYNYPKCNKGLCSWDYIKNKLNSYLDCALSFCDDNFTSSSESKNSSSPTSTKSTGKKVSTRNKSGTINTADGGGNASTASSSTKSQGKKTDDTAKQNSNTIKKKSVSDNSSDTSTASDKRSSVQ